ncbi:hypothetical protein FF38_08312 [Lucilia cuprina]|uniref:Uncharacterized protein n=1 Tax=Lucilia cuprina TaxID=7375 RepID=A0A0L0CPE9_LUCCU|nr:hypothetical protein FF38_08312 [Lucilia cuprina]
MPAHFSKSLRASGQHVRQEYNACRLTGPRIYVQLFSSDAPSTAAYSSSNSFSSSKTSNMVTLDSSKGLVDTSSTLFTLSTLFTFSILTVQYDFHFFSTQKTNNLCKTDDKFLYLFNFFCNLSPLYTKQ